MKTLNSTLCGKIYVVGFQGRGCRGQRRLFGRSGTNDRTCVLGGIGEAEGASMTDLERWE